MKARLTGYAARRPWYQFSPAVVTALVVVAALAGLWIFKVIDPVQMLFGKSEPSHRGQIAIPVGASPIPAYTKVNRDHLWNRTTGSFAVIYLRPEQIPSDVFRSLNQVIGRVVNHDKPPMYAFTEADFFPKGTRPGLVGAIPPGKRAMRVPLERIPGLVGLLPGDRFDLVSTLAIDPGAATGLAAGGVYGRQLDMQARLLNYGKQATVRVVVQAGDIVEPMKTRNVPVASSTMTSGLIVRTKPVQEVVIAVAPREVARLTEALAVGADIACVPRSGRPDDPVDSVTPESLPVSPYASYAQDLAGGGNANPDAPSRPTQRGLGAGFSPIESISGGKREILAAPVKR